MRLARTKRGLTQQELSARANRSTGYICQLERGDDDDLPTNAKIVDPRLGSISELAKALGVPEEWLAFGTGPEPDWDASSAPEDGAAA